MYFLLLLMSVFVLFYYVCICVRLNSRVLYVFVHSVNAMLNTSVCLPYVAHTHCEYVSFYAFKFTQCI